MKRVSVVLFVICAVLILSASVGTAMAYFTTYTRAQGGYTLAGSPETELIESFEDWSKSITVVNEVGSGPVFIRVRAYAGSDYVLIYDGDDNWIDGGDGWWYYTPILEAQKRQEDGTIVGGTASGLTVSIDGIPADAALGDSFNVVVVYESTPVQYDESGAAFADWAMHMDAGSVE